MNSLIAAACAACLTLVPSSAAAGELEDVVTRTYRLVDVLPDGGHAVELPLVPLAMPIGHESWPVAENDDAPNLESFVDVAVSMLEEYDLIDWDYPFDLWWSDEHTLTMRATESTHAALGRVIDGLHAATRRGAMVELTTYRLDGVAPGGAVDVESAEVVASRRVSLHLGSTEVVAAETSHVYVHRWSSEIAQLAAISQPFTRSFDVGLHWVLRLEDVVGGGLRLRHAQRVSEIAGWETRDLSMYAHIALDERIAASRMVGAIDRPHIAFGTAWGEAALADDGGTTWVTTQVDGEWGTVSYATRLRVLAVDPAPTPIPLGNNVVAWFVDASDIRWPSFDVGAFSHERLRPREETDSGEWVEAMSLGFPSRRWGPVDEAANVVEELDERGSNGMLRNRWIGSWMLLVGQEQTVAAAAAAMRAFGRDTRGADVEVVVTRRVRGGEPAEVETVAHTRVGLDERGRAGALVGHQTTVVRGYEVDVANSSSIAQPLVAGAFDGLAVRCHDGGRDRVGLDVVLHLSRDDAEVDLKVDSLGLLDRVGAFHVHWTGDVKADGERHTTREFAVEHDHVYDLHVTVTPR